MSNQLTTHAKAIEIIGLVKEDVIHTIKSYLEVNGDFDFEDNGFSLTTDEEDVVRKISIINGDIKVFGYTVESETDEQDVYLNIEDLSIRDILEILRLLEVKYDK